MTVSFRPNVGSKSNFGGAMWKKLASSIVIDLLVGVGGIVLILGAMALSWWVSNDFSFYKTIRY